MSTPILPKNSALRCFFFDSAGSQSWTACRRRDYFFSAFVLSDVAGLASRPESMRRIQSPEPVSVDLAFVGTTFAVHEPADTLALAIAEGYDFGVS